jgi:glycosidase
MAGFTSGKLTWLPLSVDYQTRNVETQSTDPNSFLSLYRQLGELRNASDALKYGDIEVVDVSNPEVLAYVRFTENSRMLTLVNFSAGSSDVRLSALAKWRLNECEVSSTLIASDVVSNKLRLEAFQGAVFTIAPRHS